MEANYTKAELVRLNTELARLNDHIDRMASHLHRLAIDKDEAMKKAKYYAELTKEIRKMLGVESSKEILPALKKIAGKRNSAFAEICIQD